MIENGMIYYGRKGSDEGIGDILCMRPDRANRHGFICGATGTGKSVTLKVLAESFSQLGVPVFLSDVKGDMAGIAVPGDDNENMQERLDRFGIRETFRYQGYPVSIFDIYSEKGTPLRTTVSEMGPQLFSQVLDLNDTQTELMQVIFKIADDLGLLLTDTKDMKAMLQYAADHSADFRMDYGNIPQQTASTIIRAIVALESEGADRFFGEPAIDIRDFFLNAPDGRGIINILDAETLINKPRLYSAFMLYLLSELFEVLPEVGDPDKPKIVFFFDEAHLLFRNASKSLMEKIEQVVKLIRSKGVSIFFVTQSPGDIPDAVMAQLGNKIEHGLHAYTPAEQKAVRAAAESFRINPEFDTENMILNLGTGEAVVSVLDEKGAPGMAEHAYILPPESRMGPLSDEERAELVAGSFLNSKYETMVDDISAYEVITGRTPAAPVQAGGGYTYSSQFNIPVQVPGQISAQEAAYAGQAQAAAHTSQAAESVYPETIAGSDEISFDFETVPAEQISGTHGAASPTQGRMPAGTIEEAQAELARKTSDRYGQTAQRTDGTKTTGRSSGGSGSVKSAAAGSGEGSGGGIGDLADNLLGRSGTRQVIRSTGGSIGREVGKAIGEAVLGKKGKTIGGNIGAALGRNLFGTLSRR